MKQVNMFLTEDQLRDLDELRAGTGAARATFALALYLQGVELAKAARAKLTRRSRARRGERGGAH